MVEGYWDDSWAPVVEEFEHNFSARGEGGASLCITHEGATVVDVWGGSFSRDSIVTISSATKGATALCAHILHSRGQLDYEAPVSEYWPEFAANGKDKVTVRMMLDHSAGVPVLRKALDHGELYDWDHVVELLEAEPPFWEPGTRSGYHMLNFGWMVGELVRRISGRSVGTFFQDEVATPLGIDFWIGLPQSMENRVLPTVPFDPARGGGRMSAFASDMLGDPASIAALATRNVMSTNGNSRDYRAAEMAAGGGVTNARGLAGMYGPLAVDDGQLVDGITLRQMRRISTATNDDATLRLPTRFSLGFMVSMDNRAKPESDSVIIGDEAFGHVGSGGHLGFADPAIGLSFGYAMDTMGPGILLDERGQVLVDAAYRIAT